MVSYRSYFCAFLSLLVIGCATQTKKKVSAELSEPQSLSQRLAESGGYKQDADGNWAPTSNKRSSFEHQGESPYFKGKIEKKAYQTGDFEKTSWWGKKTYQKTEYKGDTDGSRFKIESQQQGKVAYLGNKKVDTLDPYRTNKLEYGDARESDAKQLDKPRNDYAESRRRSYVQPSVIDWEEQRKLSMEESRSILGR
jgi:hypothetical protein